MARGLVGPNGGNPQPISSSGDALPSSPPWEAYRVRTMKNSVESDSFQYVNDSALKTSFSKYLIKSDS